MQLWFDGDEADGGFNAYLEGQRKFEANRWTKWNGGRTRLDSIAPKEKALWALNLSESAACSRIGGAQMRAD